MFCGVVPACDAPSLRAKVGFRPMGSKKICFLVGRRCACRRLGRKVFRIGAAASCSTGYEGVKR